jgi:hypothetical protein
MTQKLEANFDLSPQPPNLTLIESGDGSLGFTAFNLPTTKPNLPTQSEAEAISGIVEKIKAGSRL